MTSYESHIPRLRECDNKVIARIFVPKRDDKFTCSTLTFKSLMFTCTNKFKIQQLYALPTLYLCVLYLSESKQRLVPLTA